MASERKSHWRLVCLLMDAVWTSAAVVSVSDWLLATGNGKEELNHASVRFEDSDAQPKPVILAGVAVLLLALVAVGIVFLVFEHLKHEHAEQSPPPLPITAKIGHGVPQPPEPRLQENPPRDLERYIAEQEKALHSYGWVDKQGGVVSIPIDRAIDLIVQRGIPPQKAAPNLFYFPHAGTRLTGLEGKVEPQPR